jgi:hypothetical protein
VPLLCEDTASAVLSLTKIGKHECGGGETRLRRLLRTDSVWSLTIQILVRLFDASILRFTSGVSVVYCFKDIMGRHRSFDICLAV